MKNWILRALICSALAPFVAPAQTNLISIQSGTNGLNLVVLPIQTNGALFLQMAGDLQTLANNPTPILQTDFPLTNGIQVPLNQLSSSNGQAFFSTAFYPNQSIKNFGDPENGDSVVDPEMQLVASGLPNSLTNGLPFTVSYYINIDHGDGWTSRYLHLDQTSFLVKSGQPVTRGTPLASRLYNMTGPHLHFEVRYDSNNGPHWTEGQPGIAQDSGLLPGIFPYPKATGFPQIVVFGLSPLSPGKNVEVPCDNIFSPCLPGQA